MFQQVQGSPRTPLPPSPHAGGHRNALTGLRASPGGLPGVIGPGRPFPFSRQHLKRPAATRRSHSAGPTALAALPGDFTSVCW